MLLNNQVIASRKIFQLLFSLSVKQIEVERLVDGCYLLLSVDIASRLEGECFFFSKIQKSAWNRAEQVNQHNLFLRSVQPVSLSIQFHHDNSPRQCYKQSPGFGD